VVDEGTVGGASSVVQATGGVIGRAMLTVPVEVTAFDLATRILVLDVFSNCDTGVLALRATYISALAGKGSSSEAR
jgi:hypothetical protein